MTTFPGCEHPPHYHCPNDCEKPQPIKDYDGKRYCGRCLHEGRGQVEVFFCTPVTCPKDFEQVGG
jgi:hypothetical protein